MNREHPLAMSPSRTLDGHVLLEILSRPRYIKTPYLRNEHSELPFDQTVKCDRKATMHVQIFYGFDGSNGLSLILSLANFKFNSERNYLYMGGRWQKPSTVATLKLYVCAGSINQRATAIRNNGSPNVQILSIHARF